MGLTVAAIGVVVWFFHWTVRTSGGFQPPGEEDYYNFLVRGWRQGHLYLSKAPSPELLALADPYDPVQNSAVRMGDASYFKGHYYLYFSGAPAVVLLWPYGAITGRELGTTTAIFIFCVMGFLAATGLWLALRRRYFPGSAWWTAPLVVVLLGVSTHVLVLMRRPLVWELPLSSGFAFSMLALGAVYQALHGRRPVAAMTLAGICYGLAVASRPTCVFGAVLFVPVLWQLRRTLGGGARWWRCASVAAAGVGVCVVALLGHNYARFGNALEFGITYQLSSAYEAKEQHFAQVSRELRAREPGEARRSVMGDWVRANHAFHDVIYRVADLPLVEQLAKSARRSFSGPAVWAPGDHSIDGLYAKNVEQHRAIRQSLAAGSPAGARELAREHVMSSFVMLETILEQVGGSWPQPKRQAAKVSS